MSRQVTFLFRRPYYISSKRKDVTLHHNFTDLDLIITRNICATGDVEITGTPHRYVVVLFFFFFCIH